MKEKIFKKREVKIHEVKITYSILEMGNCVLYWIMYTYLKTSGENAKRQIEDE